MVSVTIRVQDKDGLHLRPAKQLCETAMKYQSKITFTIHNTTANAKSILGVLAAGVKHNDELTVFCEGTDEEEALQAIKELVQGL